MREPDPSQRVQREFNAIPQPKIALTSSQPATSPVPSAASPLALAAITPFAKPKQESESSPAPVSLNVALLSAARPRVKPQQIIQLAALPAATPSAPQRAPARPAKVETPKDGIAAIIAATGEKTPDSLRPLINTQLAYASSAAPLDLRKDKFSKTSALSAQAPFTKQRLPNLLPNEPQPQTIVANVIYAASLVGFATAPQVDTILMLDPALTAENRRTITMQHPDQNRLTSLMASVSSLLKETFTTKPYRPTRARVKRGPAIAWLETINTSALLSR